MLVSFGFPLFTGCYDGSLQFPLFFPLSPLNPLFFKSPFNTYDGLRGGGQRDLCGYPTTFPLPSLSLGANG